jgi:predicted 2-oxoglutarate/Fe(II)-dependent dioxygenase YbiX
MIDYKEETAGVIAVPLYQVSACQAVLASVRRLDDWQTATVRVPSIEGSYDSVTQPEVRAASISPSYHLSELFPEFEEEMTTTIKPLIKHFWGVDLREHSGTQLVRYLPGGRYFAHKDAGMDLEDRYFSVVCYLNDDFEGGATWFPHLDYRCVPQSGKTILFPANYLHSAEPVLKGEKYVVVSWLLGPVPVKWI